MAPLRQIWLLAFLATAIYTAPAAAQATVSGTEDEPREVVGERAAAAEIDPVLRAFPRSARFGALRQDFGLDLLRAPTEMAILDPSEVGRHALDAGRVEAAKAALDDKIVISTTAVIIGLLVLILILAL